MMTKSNQEVDLLQMVQQAIESKLTEMGLHNPENNLFNRDKQPPVTVKKTALRDLQNENRIMTSNVVGNSTLTKDNRGPSLDNPKVSGTKRPLLECPESPSRYQSSSNNAANGHLVYVRRKCESELGKRSNFDSTSIGVDCSHPRQNHSEETTQQKLQIKEPRIPCFPAFAPLPMASMVNSSAKPSVPPSLGKVGMKLATAEPSYQPVAPAVPSWSNSKGIKNMHWEERFHQLQVLLKKLDQSDLEDYVQMLRSFSSVELSRHAVELEKRSIQLSLEEAKEVQRVGLLNVLGKSMKNFKAPSTHQGQ